jgi:hypothetical protein
MKAIVCAIAALVGFGWGNVHSVGDRGAHASVSITRTISQPERLRIRVATSTARAVVSWSESCADGTEGAGDGGTFIVARGATFDLSLASVVRHESCTISVNARLASIGAVVVRIQERSSSRWW